MRILVRRVAWIAAVSASLMIGGIAAVLPAAAEDVCAEVDLIGPVENDMERACRPYIGPTACNEGTITLLVERVYHFECIPR